MSQPGLFQGCWYRSRKKNISDMYETDRSFLKCIIAGDETWAYSNHDNEN